jgi:hypothetical protein
MLKRLLLLVDGFTMALIGRGGNDMALGDPGGEVAMVAMVATTVGCVFSLVYRLYSKSGYNRWSR